jgi:hypothetical protein
MDNEKLYLLYEFTISPEFLEEVKAAFADVLPTIGHSLALPVIGARTEGMQCSTAATAMLVKRPDR